MFARVSSVVPILGVVLSLAPTHATAGPPSGQPFVVVLGVAQDAGHPQAGCTRSCCAPAWADPSLGHLAASLGIVDPGSGQRWLIDATPDFRQQLRALDTALGRPPKQAGPDGILLTHAHMGHYTGLLQLGREVMGAKAVPTHVMPKMSAFLANNAPWEMLGRLGYIELQPLVDGRSLALSDSVQITPFAVPHRDEYSETVGFKISGPNRSVLWLPDIDKWERWDTPIETVLASVDRAWVDGTFFENGEIPGRDMSQIPHPFMQESLERLGGLPPEQRDKVHFVHLNHTNPALVAGGEAQATVEAAGMHIAQEGQAFGL